MAASVQNSIVSNCFLPDLSESPRNCLRSARPVRTRNGCSVRGSQPMKFFPLRIISADRRACESIIISPAPRATRIDAVTISCSICSPESTSCCAKEWCKGAHASSVLCPASCRTNLSTRQAATQNTQDACAPVDRVDATDYDLKQCSMPADIPEASRNQNTSAATGATSAITGDSPCSGCFSCLRGRAKRHV
jgi:hypothetical protein